MKINNMFEIEFNKGIKDLVLKELNQKLPSKSTVFDTENDNNIRIKTNLDFNFKNIKLINSVYTINTYLGKKPSCILNDASFVEISELIKRVNKKIKSKSFKISMPGDRTGIAKKIFFKLSEKTGLIKDQKESNLKIIIRKSIYKNDAWDVLIRLTAFPLSKRNWRSVNYVGSVSGPLAAAALNMVPNKHSKDSILNLMCGSASFLCEANGYKTKVGIDNNQDAINAAIKNTSNIKKGVFKFLNLDIKEFNTKDLFDVIIADPPWGEKISNKKNLATLYNNLFLVSNNFLKQGAYFIVLTQEKNLMITINQELEGFKLLEKRKVYQGGYHPFIYLYKKGN